MPIEALARPLAPLPEGSRRSVADSAARLAALGEATGLAHEQIVTPVRRPGGRRVIVVDTSTLIELLADEDCAPCRRPSGVVGDRR